MRNLNVSEIFYSLQGEGRYVGVPSIFIRLFGCNLSCPSFGEPSPGIRKEPVGNIDVKEITSIKELSSDMFTTGCDSGYAHLKEFRHLSRKVPTPDLANESCELVPRQAWNTRNTRNRGMPFKSNNYKAKVIGYAPASTVHVVITGGEPLLQQKGLADYIKVMYQRGIVNFTIETNGTIPLSDNFAGTLAIMVGAEFTFSVSPKLSNSGERQSKALVPKAVKSYGRLSNAYVYLKFVVRSTDQNDEILLFINAYNSARCNIKDIYLMPEGATNDQYNSREKAIAYFCLYNGFLYSPRLHIDLFGNEIGT